MKKLFVILLSLTFCTALQGQIKLKQPVNETALNSLRSEFQESLAQKDVQKSADNIVKLNDALLLNKLTSEARAAYLQLETLIYNDGKANKRNNYNYHFFVAKERLKLYTLEKDAQRSKQQFDQMSYFMRFLGDDSQTDNILLAKAEYFHAFGMEEKSLDSYASILSRCLTVKPDGEKNDCFSNMIAYAEQEKNTSLKEAVEKRQVVWQDSIQMTQAMAELVELKAEHATLQADFADKEQSITTNKLIIGGLGVVIAALIAALLVLFFLYARCLFRMKKAKESLRILEESNNQKSTFLSNINSQISPRIEDMEAAVEGTTNIPLLREELHVLKKSITDMQTYISLEAGREEAYPTSNLEVSSFCEAVMSKAKVNFNLGVEPSVAAPRITIKTNAEALGTVLTYLLSRSSLETKSGKISLEFKKRNARTGQFIITDTGEYIPIEEQEDIFKPFTQTTYTRKDDAWGLPISKLMVYKLNGTLKIDSEYKKGTRFIIDLCS